MKGDLHTHTFQSDGSNSAERLFQLAARSGLDYIAITDHDHLEGFSRDCSLSEKYGIKAFHGTELSAFDYLRERRVHILCYFPDDLEPIRKLCVQTTQSRMEAGLEMARLVAQKYPITVEDVIAAASRSDCIFKQHIMQALMDAGYAAQMYGELWKELFDSRTGSCVRTCKQPDVWEALSVLRQAGGICVMAHPYTYNSIDLLDELVGEHLLDGVEVWSSKSNREQEAYLLEKAARNRLIPTGGSDFHGSTASRFSPLGSAYTPEDSLRALLALKGKTL